MADKVMVFETDLEIEQRIAGLLFEAGYEVSSKPGVACQRMRE